MKMLLSEVSLSFMKVSNTEFKKWEARREVPRVCAVRARLNLKLTLTSHHGPESCPSTLPAGREVQSGCNVSLRSEFSSV